MTIRNTDPQARLVGAHLHRLFKPLGYRQKVNGSAKGFGDWRRLDFFLDEGERTANVDFAFRADSRDVVDRIDDAGRAAGFTLDRAPALVPQVRPTNYAGYLRDLDGRLVEFVCLAPAKD